MGKFYKEAMIFKTKQQLAFLDEMMAIYEKARADGKDDNDPSTKELINQKILKMENKILKEIDTLTKKSEGAGIEPWDFSQERMMRVFAEDEVILLRPLQAQNRDLYIQVKKENANTISMKPEEEQIKYWNDIWDDTKDEKQFILEVILKENNNFVGYVAVNNTRQLLWELSIELLNGYHCHGYGTHALRLFVDKLYAITGREEYQALVEIDTVKCQGMLGHMNAELVGIHCIFFACEEDAVEFEEQYLDEIDEHMRTIATKLGIEPRKLISHVLDYRVKPQKSMIQ